MHDGLHGKINYQSGVLTDHHAQVCSEGHHHIAKRDVAANRRPRLKLPLSAARTPPPKGGFRYRRGGTACSPPAFGFMLASLRPHLCMVDYSNVELLYWDTLARTSNLGSSTAPTKYSLAVWATDNCQLLNGQTVIKQFALCLKHYASFYQVLVLIYQPGCNHLDGYLGLWVPINNVFPWNCNAFVT